MRVAVNCTLLFATSPWAAEGNERPVIITRSRCRQWAAGYYHQEPLQAMSCRLLSPGATAGNERPVIITRSRWAMSGRLLSPGAAGQWAAGYYHQEPLGNERPVINFLFTSAPISSKFFEVFCHWFQHQMQSAWILRPHINTLSLVPTSDAECMNTTPSYKHSAIGSKSRCRVHEYYALI